MVLNQSYWHPVSQAGIRRNRPELEGSGNFFKGKQALKVRSCDDGGRGVGSAAHRLCYSRQGVLQ